jgi:hypothetical protein
MKEERAIGFMNQRGKEENNGLGLTKRKREYSQFRN